MWKTILFWWLYDASPAERPHDTMEAAIAYAKIRSAMVQGEVKIVGPNGQLHGVYRDGKEHFAEQAA